MFKYPAAVVAPASEEPRAGVRRRYELVSARGADAASREILVILSHQRLREDVLEQLLVRFYRQPGEHASFEMRCNPFGDAVGDLSSFEPALGLLARLQGQAHPSPGQISAALDQAGYRATSPEALYA
ncbi:hypothetical protein [Thioalkalivibrio thiocyanodenitrificans]|uniref:hypothetical protein n=1 Tax=Thioalkalivibrio thiocyanodenitrificans TaxID=243063 RepID=UPI00037B497F|nr:hypothetical protein [Thioalkalivibrio thiocyanodenitrificans]